VYVYEVLQMHIEIREYELFDYDGNTQKRKFCVEENCMKC